jgi:uncharacterized protein (UPF0218 family)
MPIVHIITPELRKELKKPLGRLIRGSFAETMEKFRDFVDKEKPPSIISVGDTVTKNLSENLVIPQLSIIDNKCMRRRIQRPPPTGQNVIRVKNPQGTITAEAINAVQEALKSNNHIQIVVDGEEDLLTLIAVLHAPENSLVVYGQPYLGIVVVKATAEKKAEVMDILKAMKTVRKAK